MGQYAQDSMELSLFPYTKTGLELYSEARFLLLSERYMESFEFQSVFGTESEYIEDKLIKFTEDAADAASDVISKCCIWIKNIWRKFIGIFKLVKEKIEAADKKYKEEVKKSDGTSLGTVDSVLRQMVKQQHQWSSKEIEDYVKNNKSGSLKKWARMKLSVEDPDIQGLQFYPGVDDLHKEAFKNILTFSLAREQNPTVRVKDLLSEEQSLPSFFTSASSKVLIASGGTLAISTIPNILDRITQAHIKNDEEALSKEWNDLQSSIKSLQEERDNLNMQFAIPNLSQKRLTDLNNRISHLDAEIKQKKARSDELIKQEGELNKKMRSSQISAKVSSLSIKILSVLGITVSAGLFIIGKISDLVIGVANGIGSSLSSVIK